MPGIDNGVYVPGAGEIYQILGGSRNMPWKTNEIVLASYAGLYFGRFKTMGIKMEWESTKIYLRDKLISQVCQISPERYLVAEYSQPGYYIIDRNEVKSEESLSKDAPRKPWYQQPPQYSKI